MESHPENKAPEIKTKGSLLEERIKAKQIPGSMECAIASPTKALFLRKEKLPTIAAVAPKIMVPNNTKRKLGSVKMAILRSCVLFLLLVFFPKRIFMFLNTLPDLAQYIQLASKCVL